MRQTAVHLFVVALLAGSAFEQDAALREPEWKATVRVVDETGQAVPGAEVRIGFSSASPQGGPVPDKIVGLTDTNGMFVTAHVDRSVQLDFDVQKAGYYRFSTQHFFGFSDKDKPDWNPSPTLILKKIRNPIPMYAKPVSYFMPTNGQPIGFDLMSGDWVEPYGQGKSKDIIFTTRFDKRSEDDYDYNFRVSFPNRGDGIQGFEFPYPTGQGSALRSPHEAPEHGYEPELVKLENARPGQFAKDIWNEKTNYFFRVRTVLDEHGGVKSALYGKIYGDFNQFRYYLNPTPNDRNVEFAPGKNLLKNLKRTEAVNQP